MKSILYSALVLMIIINSSYSCPSDCDYPRTEAECQQCLKSSGDQETAFSGGQASFKNEECQIHGPKLHQNNCNSKVNRMFKDCYGFSKADFYLWSQRCWVVFKKAVCPPNCDSPKDQPQCELCLKSTSVHDMSFANGLTSFENSVCKIHAPGLNESKACNDGVSRQFKNCSGFAEPVASYSSSSENLKCWAYFR